MYFHPFFFSMRRRTLVTDLVINNVFSPLFQHEKTHLGQEEKKVYNCHIPGCPQVYTRSDALARHQWNAHRIRPQTVKIRHLASVDGGQLGNSDLDFGPNIF
jgi:hypothetical protein